jgi:hypothetical protein
MVYFKMPGNTVMTRDLEDARRYLNKPESWRV